jgi:hypothetical protein
MVNEFKKDSKPLALQKLGISRKSKMMKVNDLLESAIKGDYNDLMANIDNMQAKWEENHGPVSLSIGFSSNN